MIKKENNVADLVPELGEYEKHAQKLAVYGYKVPPENWARIFKQQLETTRQENV